MTTWTQAALDKAAAKKPAALRPAYQVVPWFDSPAFRFVAHGLTDAQVEMLRQACAAAGIREQT